MKIILTFFFLLVVLDNFNNIIVGIVQFDVIMQNLFIVKEIVSYFKNYSKFK